MSPLMNVETLQAPPIDWWALSPVIVVLGAGVLGVLVEAFASRKMRRTAQILLSIIAILSALVLIVSRWTTVLKAPASLGEYVEDPLTLASQAILLVIGFLSILVFADRSELGDGYFANQPADAPGSSNENQSIAANYQRTEMFPLMLFSLGGMMVFPAASARRRRQLSHEAALKYFILGAFSSGFFLMGLAFLYGYSGSLYFSRVSRLAPLVPGMDWLLVAGVFMVMVGLLFKVGAAPFHAWTPDVYQGSPTPVTGFMAAAVKIAAFAAMIRIYLTVTNQFRWDLLVIFMVVAVLTMLVGTFAGLVQTDVKRLLAYSSIAHAGFILIGVIAADKATTASVLFYALAYGIATVGAFGVIALVRHADANANITGEATELKHWAGVGRKSPLVAGSMLLFLLSFAGIPLTSGFVGKLFLFSAGIGGGQLALVIIALVCSAITAFYYFRLVVLMFFEKPNEGTVVVQSEGYTYIAVLIAAALTIALGIFPGPVLEVLSNVVVLLP